MSSSKYSLYSPMNLLVFSICMVLILIVDVVVISPMVLRSYDRVMQLDPLEQSRPGFRKEREQSRADFHEQFGFWGRSRQTLYASFVLPPIIGFSPAMAFRGYIKNLLLKNQHRFKKEIRRRLMRWDGIGLKELREDISTFPQFLPLFIAFIFVFVLDTLVFPGAYSSMSAFSATCGFIGYPTWKQIFADAMSLQASD